MKKLPLVLIAVLLLAMPVPAAGSSRLAAPPLLPGEYIVDLLTDTVGLCPSGAMQCTLRTAIETANGDGINSSITFSVTGTIELALGSLPPVTDAHLLTITGPLDGITISGMDAYQILSVSSAASLTLNNLTFAHGKTSLDGGAISNTGTLHINQCVFQNNATTGDYDTGWGGAIYNASPGIVTVDLSTFLNNQALHFSGGAIANISSVGEATTTMQVTRSTFQGNYAAESGGAIFNHALKGGLYALLSVDQSLFRDNTAGLNGGAIYHGHETTTVINSTLTGNSAAHGGAIYNAMGLSVYLINDTIVNNTATDPAGWNIQDTSGPIYTRNTIVTGTSPEKNCGGGNDITWRSDGNNIDNGASCRFGSDNGSHSNTNPQLNDLADNGGPTLTMALKLISPAVDAVTEPPSFVSIDCPLVDQRGVARPILGKPFGTPLCDIGAYEFEPPTWLLVFLPLITR